MIRPVASDDFKALRDIYNYYIIHTAVTFDTEEITTDAVEERITLNAKYPCLVYIEANELIGFAAGSAWKPKSAYDDTVEFSIYLHRDYCGRGYGKPLVKAFIELLRQQGRHSLISGIIMPKDRSVGLHEKLNFKKVAHFSESGKKFGKWMDVAYWQLLL